MDNRIQIWNVLHDGEITAISEDDGNLTMFVNIPYLRRRLKPLGDSFILTLSGIRQVEYRDSNGAPLSLHEEVENCTPEILQTKSESMPIIIETTMGQLILDFQSLGLALDTGQRIEFETISKICEEYWSEWQAKNEQARRGT